MAELGAGSSLQLTGSMLVELLVGVTVTVLVVAGAADTAAARPRARTVKQDFLCGDEGQCLCVWERGRGTTNIVGIFAV